jgi:ribosomal protein S18 acetylase RimI-like enzyme
MNRLEFSGLNLMNEQQNFSVIVLGPDSPKRQLDQFVEMMQRMYEYHATLHQDWEPRPGWQEGSTGWLSGAASSNDYFFAIAYPVGPDAKEMLDTPAGYIICSFHFEAPLFVQHRFGYIADLWSEEAYRTAGVGNQLLAKAYEWFKGQGVSRVQIEVDVKNPGGLIFWEKAGFEPFEIVMRKNLD